MPLEIKPNNFLPWIFVSLCEHHLSLSTHQDEPQHQAQHQAYLPVWCSAQLTGPEGKDSLHQDSIIWNLN